MSEDTKTDAPIISARVDPDVKRQIDDESELRGHTRSQAIDQIIKLGLPRYLKKFPKKYERVDNAA